MAFTQLVNAQQVEIVVAGPGDVNRLYVVEEGGKILKNEKLGT